MTRHILTITLAAVLGMAFGGGTAEAQRTPEPITYGLAGMDVEAVAAEAMKLYDKDTDGKIAGAELDASPALKASVKWLDQNADGALDQKEIMRQMKAWCAAKVGLCTPMMMITLDGKPVKSGKVTLTPEPFLGKHFHPAEGAITDGMCVPSCDVKVNPDELPGMSWGFYTVTFSGIKTGGEEILVEPVGVEISSLNPDYREASMYELKLTPCVKAKKNGKKESNHE